MKNIGRVIKGCILVVAVLLVVNLSCVSHAAKYLDVTATVQSKSKIEIKWKKKSVDGYEIYRATCSKDYIPKTYKKIANVSAKKTKYVDKTVKSNKRYDYIVKGYKKIGGRTKYTYEGNVNAYTGIAKVMWENHSEHVDTSSKAITLDASTVETGIVPAGYEFYRKEGSSDWKKIATVKKKKMGVKYVDTTVEKGKKYSYKFRIYVKSGGKKKYGKFSNVIKLTAINDRATYQLHDYTNVQGKTKSIVVGLTSDEGNGVTEFNPDSTLYYQYSKKKGKKSSSTELVPVKYSYDNINWNDFNEYVEISENQTIYIMFESKDGKEFNFMTSKDYYSSITWESIEYSEDERDYTLIIDFTDIKAFAMTNQS